MWNPCQREPVGVGNIFLPLKHAVKNSAKASPAEGFDRNHMHICQGKGRRSHVRASQLPSAPSPTCLLCMLQRMAGDPRLSDTTSPLDFLQKQPVTSACNSSTACAYFRCPCRWCLRAATDVQGNYTDSALLMWKNNKCRKAQQHFSL